MIQRELNTIVTNVADERNIQSKVQILEKIYSKNNSSTFTKFIATIPTSYMWLYQAMMPFGDSATLSYTSAIVPYYNQWMKKGNPLTSLVLAMWQFSTMKRRVPSLSTSKLK